MNPFELTKDPDGGGTTVRAKHDFVVLTREEDKRVAERITEILTENAKLRELVREAVDAASLKDMRDWRYGKRLAFLREARELGIEGDA